MYHVDKIYQHLTDVTCMLTRYISVHTADTTPLDFAVGKFVQTCRDCRQLHVVANSVYTADVTQLDSWVASASAACIGLKTAYFVGGCAEYMSWKWKREGTDWSAELHPSGIGRRIIDSFTQFCVCRPITSISTIHTVNVAAWRRHSWQNDSITTQ